MRTTTLLAAVGILLGIAWNSAAAQTRTEETITTTDSTGKETTTKVVKIGSSEDITVRNNMITINPLKFFLFYNLTYYHAFSKGVVGGIGAQLPTPSGVGGFGLNAEVRLHPSGKGPRGFYVAPNISYNRLTDESDVAVTAFSIGALAGWQWFPGDEFAIGLGIGIDQYFLSASDDNESTSFESFDGLAPALRFDIGYAW